MRILLLGSTGQVGWELHRALQPLGQVIGVGRNTAALTADLSQPESLRALLRDIKPDVIVNAAAYTAVDKAEDESELAYAINAESLHVLAEESAGLHAGLIHFSTDYVFDGASKQPYHEQDPVNPLSVYGRSKLAGEQAVVANSAAYAIFRTQWVYGTRGNNFLLTMQRLARERTQLNVVNDQFGAPTWCRLLAEATAGVLAQGHGDPVGLLRERSGVYHLSCAGQCAWFDFASAIIARTAPSPGGALARINAITTAEYPTKARRPAYGVLDNARFHSTFGLRLPDWQTGLELVLT